MTTQMPPVRSWSCLVGVLSLVLLTRAPCRSQPIRILIDPEQTFQTMEGWGGSLYPQTLPYFSEDSTFEDHLLTDLHTTHIRLRNVWYLLEAENDNDDPFEMDYDRLAAADTGLVHDELVLQQRLQERGVHLLFSSWRFPYWMIGKPPDWIPGADDKPDLPPGMDDEYVESLLGYILYARDRYGITFDAISVANEPDLSIYIGGLDPERLLRLSWKLRDRLDAAGYKTSFYMPDVAAADSIGQNYTERFYALEGGRHAAGAIAFHSYRREDEVLRYFGDLGALLGLPVWVTEQNHAGLAVENRFEWSHAVNNAACLHDVLVRSNASLSLYWSYAMSSSRGLGLYVPETKTWAPAYDMLKHFYNFVPPGSKRIESVPIEAEGGLRTVAFIRPDSLSAALIIINEGSEPLKARVAAADAEFLMTRVVTSTAASHLAETAVDSVLTLAPMSITTAEFQRQQE